MIHFTPFPDLDDVLTQLTAGLQRVLGSDLARCTCKARLRWATPIRAATWTFWQ